MTPTDEEIKALVERLRKDSLYLEQNYDHEPIHYVETGIGEEAADALEALSAQVAELRAERDAARQALEHDRSKAIEAVNQFSDAFARRSWLLEGRGSYEWDDDRYRDEFRAAYDELYEPIKKLRKIGRDWSNCPTNHDEIMHSRVDWQRRAIDLEVHRDRLGSALRAAKDAIWSGCDTISATKAIDAALSGSSDPRKDVARRCVEIARKVAADWNPQHREGLAGWQCGNEISAAISREFSLDTKEGTDAT